jgi:asparagine synthase (glutamine-hydrolysing)
MSAIAGLYRTNGGPASRHEVERMISALTHRGPDGARVWVGNTVGLGHAALWTTPEARREQLPLTDEAGALVITADARIDNRRALQRALGISDPSADDMGDGEFILRAYERWGEACVDRLTGDFAFAIWDGRNQQLFCARDHIGVKPFYYHEAAGAVLFASEIKALLTSPLVPYRLNRQRVADHLVGYFDDRTSTFYRDIYRLPAGHTLTLQRAGTRLRAYAALDTGREMRLGSDDEYTEAFAEAFTEAVRCRLRASHPVGCLLSGGLDTSSIVGTARRLAGPGKNLDTFTAVFPDLPVAELRAIDERSFVQALVDQGGLASHYVRGDLLSPLTDAERVLWHLDEAHAAPNLYLHWALYGAARDQGVRALLDGIDGDTTVSHGLERLAMLARTGSVLTLGRELRALSRRHGVGTLDLLRRFVLEPLVPPYLRQRVGRLRGREPNCLARTAIRPEFARQMGVVERVEALEQRREQPARTAREAHARAMQSGLIPYALEMADKAAAAFGVEPRYPFFDRRLMELCLALPVDQKLNGGWTRLVMRRAMAGTLPEKVRWRPGKANLAPNFNRRLLAQDRTVLDEVLVKHPGILEEYVDILTLRRAYERYLAHPTSEADALTVYSAVVLGLWIQRAKLAV